MLSLTCNCQSHVFRFISGCGNEAFVKENCFSAAGTGRWRSAGENKLQVFFLLFEWTAFLILILINCLVCLRVCHTESVMQTAAPLDMQKLLPEEAMQQRPHTDTEMHMQQTA